MRVPICVNDFYEYVYPVLFTGLCISLGPVHVSLLTRSLRMVIRQQIPFTRVLATVPSEMRERLPPELTGILEGNVSTACIQIMINDLDSDNTENTEG